MKEKAAQERLDRDGNITILVGSSGLSLIISSYINLTNYGRSDWAWFTLVTGIILAASAGGDPEEMNFDSYYRREIRNLIKDSETNLAVPTRSHKEREKFISEYIDYIKTTKPNS